TLLPSVKSTMSPFLSLSAGEGATWSMSPSQIAGCMLLPCARKRTFSPADKHWSPSVRNRRESALSSVMEVENLLYRGIIGTKVVQVAGKRVGDVVNVGKCEI